MGQEQIKLKINNHIEIRKYLTTYVLIASGGLVTLLLGEFNILKIFLFIAGAILDIFLLSGVMKQNEIIQTLITKIEE